MYFTKLIRDFIFQTTELITQYTILVLLKNWNYTGKYENILHFFTQTVDEFPIMLKLEIEYWNLFGKMRTSVYNDDYIIIRQETG